MSECVVRISFPTACGPCEMCGTGACKAWMKVDWKELGHTKPEDCPIICSLPEGHGRLGDLDELAAGCDDPYWCRWLSEIEDAPTIIPAEVERSET